MEARDRGFVEPTTLGIPGPCRPSCMRAWSVPTAACCLPASPPSSTPVSAAEMPLLGPDPVREHSSRSSAGGNAMLFSVSKFSNCSTRVSR